MVEGVNSPKGEFLSAVTCFKPGLMEFTHLLDQSGVTGWAVPLTDVPAPAT
jgi:hypothetical protein